MSKIGLPHVAASAATTPPRLLRWTGRFLQGSAAGRAAVDRRGRHAVKQFGLITQSAGEATPTRRPGVILTEEKERYGQSRRTRQRKKETEEGGAKGGASAAALGVSARDANSHAGKYAGEIARLARHCARRSIVGLLVGDVVGQAKRLLRGALLPVPLDNELLSLFQAIGGCGNSRPSFGLSARRVPLPAFARGFCIRDAVFLATLSPAKNRLIGNASC
jgi:hypothetical protein